MAAQQINQNTIAAIAERIVQARRLYGPDSAYIIGLFLGLELAHEGGAGPALRAKVQEQVLRLESGKGGQKGAPSPKAEAAPQQESATGAQQGDLAENTWIRGNVKWFNNDKGYGFISTAANTDVFVHWRDISSWDRSLAQGDEVEFMVTKTAKGFQAINVMKPGGEGEAGAEASKADAAVAAADASAKPDVVASPKPEPGPGPGSGSAAESTPTAAPGPAEAAASADSDTPAAEGTPTDVSSADAAEAPTPPTPEAPR